MILNGTLIPSAETRLVYDYFNKKMLMKLGYSFDSCTLSDFDVQVYNKIESVINSTKKEEIEKTRKKR